MYKNQAGVRYYSIRQCPPRSLRVWNVAQLKPPKSGGSKLLGPVAASKSASSRSPQAFEAGRFEGDTIFWPIRTSAVRYWAAFIWEHSGAGRDADCTAAGLESRTVPTTIASFTCAQRR